MSAPRPLSGSCACGRNTYIIEVPANAPQVAQVVLSSGGLHRPTPHLRIPLPWYHSTTYAFLPNETHSSIKRFYTSPLAPSSKSHFCGFCGSQLSYWSEDPPSEAEFISLALGSLSGRDLADLEDLGILRESSDDSSEEEAGQQSGSKKQISTSTSSGHDTPRREGGAQLAKRGWFDEIVASQDVSGRVTRSKGSKQVGGATIEWEITEWTSGDGEAAEGETDEQGQKRKWRVAQGEDEVMEGLH